MEYVTSWWGTLIICGLIYFGVFGANKAGFERAMDQHLQTSAEEQLSGLMSEAFVYVNFTCSIAFATFSLLFIHLVLK
jgi:uncharacterized membrane protein YesL